MSENLFTLDRDCLQMLVDGSEKVLLTVYDDNTWIDYVAYFTGQPYHLTLERKGNSMLIVQKITEEHAKKLVC